MKILLFLCVPILRHFTVLWKFLLQVIDWLDNHGDVFLKKNTSIGRSLQRSRALQKSHEHFESVAKVSPGMVFCHSPLVEILYLP